MFSRIAKIYLFVPYTESLSRVLEHIKNCPKGTQLYIEIEKNWKFMHSMVGVKQIKDASEAIEIFIFTTDSVGTKLFESVNIPSFSELPEDTKRYDEELAPERRFSLNKVGEAFDATEVEVIEIVREKAEAHISKIQESIGELSAKSKILIALSSIVSVGIFFFLLSLVLPSATITVQTKKKLIETIVNANFVKTNTSYTNAKKTSGNTFYLYPIVFHFKHEFDFPVLSKIFEGQNAFGDIILYNNYTEDITLKNGTKLQTADGLIFLTKHYVRIPARSITIKNGKQEIKPGQALVNVKASDTDLYGEIIGSRGNIAPSSFTIPGLNNYMQKLVWGESKASMRKGSTRWRMEVQGSDIDAAKKKMEKTLSDIAMTEINTYITQVNKTQSSPIALFPMEDQIQKKVENIWIAGDTLGKDIESFPVAGRMTITAWVFHQNDFYTFMQKHLENKVDPQMKIEEVFFKNMVFTKFAKNEPSGHITVGLQGRESYAIDSVSDAGKLFEQEVLEHIPGMDADAALAYLKNRKEVSDAQITIWPPVKKRLPLLRGKIEFIENN